MGRRKKGEAISGWVCLDKPLEVTSTEAVSKVRRLFNAQKAGHAGTLDPLATGILPIALGEATKTVPFLMEAEKVYRFSIEWGRTTATFDREGACTATSDVRPSREAVAAALTGFVGEIEQVPPAYSAIKVDGQRAYDLAREGVEVELEPRTVVIHEAAVTAAPDPDHVEITIRCGKGTYVRSLVRDIALAVGACGHVSALRRERVGPFATQNAITLAELAEIVHRGAGSEALLPVETALDDIPALAVTDEDAFKLKQGRPIVLLPRQVETLKPLLKPRTVAGEDASRAVSAVSAGKIVALCEMRAGKLNPTRVFHLD
jgi:tRNA pseudouridine55 synthase